MEQGRADRVIRIMAALVIAVVLVSAFASPREANAGRLSGWTCVVKNGWACWIPNTLETNRTCHYEGEVLPGQDPPSGCSTCELELQKECESDGVKMIDAKN